MAGGNRTSRDNRFWLDSLRKTIEAAQFLDEEKRNAAIHDSTGIGLMGLIPLAMEVAASILTYESKNERKVGLAFSFILGIKASYDKRVRYLNPKGTTSSPAEVFPGFGGMQPYMGTGKPAGEICREVEVMLVKPRFASEVADRSNGAS